jgi:hypothetical protein
MRIIAATIAAALATLSSVYAFTPRNLTGPIVEADNGQRYQLEDISPYGRGVQLNVYISGAPGEIILPTRMLFDCHGHMMTFGEEMGEHSQWSYVPPHSVASRIAQIACGGAKVAQ